jgi:hypothetical protein
MINWANLAANSLWILGCAVALATISYASWEASVLEERFINMLKLSSYQLALNLAGLLFSAGLATTSDTTLEIILWTILAVAFFIQMTTAYIRKRKTEKTEPPS